MSRSVAVFGGSFNPPHVGHVIAVVYVLSVVQIDEVLVVPCYIHPFAKELAPFEDRLAMCKAAFDWIPRVSVSDLERELGGESRTLRTVQTLASRHPDWSLRLVVGSDVLPETPRWFGFDDIQRIAPVLVLDRPAKQGAAPTRSVFPNVSSSAIRQAFAAGDHDAIAGLLPSAVLDYVRERGLFASGDRG